MSREHFRKLREILREEGEKAMWDYDHKVFAERRPDVDKAIMTFIESCRYGQDRTLYRGMPDMEPKSMWTLPSFMLGMMCGTAGGVVQGSLHEVLGMQPFSPRFEYQYLNKAGQSPSMID